MASRADAVMEEDTYEEVRPLSQGSEVPDKCRNVIKELIETESTYLKALRDVLQGYQEPMRAQEHLPVKTDDVNAIFGNTFELHKFSKRILKMLEAKQTDIYGLASIFLSMDQEFKIYTTYCTNHVCSIKTLAAAQQQPTAAEFFYGCQLALGHMLPLSAFLLKPVQRILKYHLLLAELKKQYGKSLGTEDETYEALGHAHKAMESVANHINSMMRTEEAKELMNSIIGWTSTDVQPGALVLDSIFRAHGSKAKRKVFVFEKLILVTKRHKDNVNYTYKGHIMHSQLEVVESPQGMKDPLAFMLASTESRSAPSWILYARDGALKTKWVHQLRRLILDEHPNLQDDVKKMMIASIESGGAVDPKSADVNKPVMQLVDLPKDRLHRHLGRPGRKKQRTTSTALETNLETNLDTSSLGGVSPSSSMTSIGSSVSEAGNFDNDLMYSDVIAQDAIYGNDLEFCPSDNEESDHEGGCDATPDKGEDTPDTGTDILEVTSSDRRESKLSDDLFDKPEVVVPMTSDNRFIAPTSRLSDQRNSISSAPRRSIGVLSGINDTTTFARTTSKKAKAKVESRVSNTFVAVAIQDVKQKEITMELTKGLVGRLVKRYTELTEDKPVVESCPSLGKTTLGSRTSVTLRTAPVVADPATTGSTSWEKGSSASSTRLAGYHSQSLNTPANRSTKSRKRSRSVSTQPKMSLGGAAPRRPVRRCGSISSSAKITGVTVSSLTTKPDPAFPTLYAVCAELRKDSWLMNRRMKQRKQSVPYGVPQQKMAPVAHGRVRDLIARFSVQPM